MSKKEEDEIEAINPSFSVNVGMLKIIKNFTLPLFILLLLFVCWNLYTDNKAQVQKTFDAQQQVIAAKDLQLADKKEAVIWLRNLYTRSQDILIKVFTNGKESMPQLTP